MCLQLKWSEQGLGVTRKRLHPRQPLQVLHGRRALGDGVVGGDDAEPLVAVPISVGQVGDEAVPEDEEISTRSNEDPSGLCGTRLLGRPG